MKSRFIITSDSESLKHFLSKNKTLSILRDIANKDKFSPSIICEDEGHWKLTTKYHIEIDDWPQVIKPTISLYKDLIDEFNKRLPNISTKAYREVK
jgi:hypothetical protein